MRHFVPVLTASLALAFVGASTAGATVHCVGSGLSGCDVSYTNAQLQNAVTAAEAGSGNVVRLAADDFPLTAALSFAGANEVTIEGQGFTSQIHGLSGTTTISTGAAKVNFKNLRVNVAAGGGSTILIDTGGASTGGASFDHVKIQATSGVSTTDALVTAIDGALTITGDSEFVGYGGDKNRCVSISDSKPLTIDRTSFKACFNGVTRVGAGNTTVTRSRFFQPEGTTSGETPRALWLNGAGIHALDNNIVTGDNSPATFTAVRLDNGTLLARYNSFVGAGLGTGVAVSTISSAQLFDNVIGSFATPVNLSGSPTFTADFNYYDEDLTSPASPLPGSTNVIDAVSGDVLFNSLTDFTPLIGSPIHDKDSVSSGRPGGEPTVDFNGAPRQVGARDLGAVERQLPVVVIPPVVPPVIPGVTPAFSGSFKFSKAKVKRKKTAKVSYSLTAPGTVTFKLKASKKKNKVPKLKPAAGKAGANTYSISTKKLKKGKYTLTATLPSGASKSASMTVTK